MASVEPALVVVAPVGSKAQAGRIRRGHRFPDPLGGSGEPAKVPWVDVALPVAPPTLLTLYIPHPESDLSRELAAGSAVVGLGLSDGRVRIYYEGNVIGAANLLRYRWRVSQAASRLLHEYPAGYPTRARADVDPREIVEIGTLEARTGQVRLSVPAAELTWWIDPADLADLTNGSAG